MKAMARFAHGFDRWAALWEGRESAASLWLCRTLVSACVAADLVAARVCGAVPGAFAAPPDGLGVDAARQWSAALLGASPAGATWLWAIALGAAVAFGIGAATRASGLVLALALAELGNYAPDGDRGIDVLLRIAILILVCSGSHTRGSFDAWLRRKVGKPYEPLVAAWPRRLLAVQMVWLYSSAAHNRGDAAWWPHGSFSALATLLSDPHFARFPPHWIPHVYPLTQLATATTMVFELGSPLLLVLPFLERTPGSGGRFGDWVRRYRLRWVWLALGVALHLGIALSMRLGIFSFGVLACYPVFLRPEELIHAAERIRGGRVRVPSD